jgi:hypothetical protein
MRKAKVVALACLLAGILMYLGCKRLREQEPESRTGLQLTLAPPHQTVRVGKPVKCIVTLRNNSPETKAVHNFFALGTQYFRIQILDQHGKEIVYKGPIADIEYPVPLFYLRPGGFVGEPVDGLIELTDAYDLSQRGRYKLTASYMQERSMFEPIGRRLSLSHFLWEGELQSNTVSVEIR